MDPNKFHLMPEFISESGAILEENAISGCHGIWRERIFNEVFSPDLKKELPRNQIDELVNTLYAMEPMAKLMLDTLYGFRESERSKNLVCTMRRSNEIYNIKLVYIDKFIETIKKECADMADGNVKPDTLIKQWSDQENFRKLKSNVISTCFQYYQTPLDIMRSSSIPMSLNGTEINVKRTIIPFLQEFYNVRLKSKETDMDNMSTGFRNASFKLIADEVIDKFKELRYNIDLFHKSMRSTMNEKPANEKALVERYFYVVFTVVLQLERYMIASCIRMMSSYLYNVNSIQKFLQQLEWQMGTEDEIVESVDTFFEQGGNTVGVLLENASKLREVVRGRINHPIKRTACDENIYRSPITVAKMMLHRISNFMEAYTKDTDSPISLLAEEAQLSPNDISTTTDTTKLVDTTFLESMDYDDQYVYTDMYTLQGILPYINADIDNTIKKAHEFKNVITEEADNFPDKLRNKDCLLFLEDFEEQMKNYKNSVVESYIARIGIIASVNNNYFESVDTDVYLESEEDYEKEIIGRYDIPMVESSEELRKLQGYYIDLYSRKMMGANIYMEADDNKEEEKKDNHPKPEINDNQQNDNNNDKNDQNTNNSENDKEKKSNVTLDAIKNRLGEVVTNLKDFVNGLKGKKNKKFLEDNREYLLNRNYATTNIGNLVKYGVNFHCTALIEKMIDKASSFTDDFLKTASEEAIRNALFGVIGSNLGDTSNTHDSLVNIFKYGTGKAAEGLMKLEGDSLKKQIPKILEFTDYYYNNFTNDLSSLQNKIDQKLEKFSEKKKSKEGNISHNVSFIMNIINDSVNVARDTMRSRANDNMTILSGLAKGNKNKDVNSEDTTDNTNDDSSEDN